MKYMFYNCFSLSIFPNISFLESKIKSGVDISYMFKGCDSLPIKPDFSRFYIKNSNENNNNNSNNNNSPWGFYPFSYQNYPIVPPSSYPNQNDPASYQFDILNLHYQLYNYYLENNNKL